MVHCGEGDCTNSGKKKQLVSKWPGRKFVRFYKMPDPERQTDLFTKWKLRIRRRPEDVNKNTRVCSEHFADGDFQPADFLTAQQLEPESMKRKWIRLKKDAVPNTDRITGEMTLHIQSNSVAGEPSTPISSRQERKRVRRDIDYIDQLIKENEEIVGSFNLICEDSDSDEDFMDATDHIDMPSHYVAPDRYLSVLISADSGNNKGVQCSPPKRNWSTQAGLSSFITLSGSDNQTSSESNEQRSSEVYYLESDSESEGDISEDSDDEYTPGPAIAAASSDKVKLSYQYLSLILLSHLIFLYLILQCLHSYVNVIDRTIIDKKRSLNNFERVAKDD